MLRGFCGVTDVVLAYRSAAVFADPEKTDLDALESRLDALEAAPEVVLEGRLVVIPVLYDGPDLEHVAGKLGLSHGRGDLAPCGFHL